MASNSSKGSVEETAEIAHSSFSTKAAAAAGQAAEDATCFVSNSVQHRKIVHRPLQSSLRGPRRIGVESYAAYNRIYQQSRTVWVLPPRIHSKQCALRVLTASSGGE